LFGTLKLKWDTFLTFTALDVGLCVFTGFCLSCDELLLVSSWWSSETGREEDIVFLYGPFYAYKCNHSHTSVTRSHIMSVIVP